MRVRYSKTDPPRAPARYVRLALPESPARERSKLLEWLLARADRIESVTDWRSEAFRLIAPSAGSMPAIAACVLRADPAAQVGRGTVFLASPTQYLVETSNVRLTDSGILALRPAEAQELAVDFNRVWKNGEVCLLATHGGRLLCLFNGTVDAATCDPEEARGRHIGDFLPAGDGSAVLRRLMSEVEMWLFEHEVNRRRAAEGLPQASALWMWGGGAVLDSLPPTRGWAAGDDVFVDAFGALPSGGEAGAPTVVVISAPPGGAGWRDAESTWLEPAVADLRSGRIAALSLSSRQRCFRVSARGVRRFWRRSRPWWEHFP